MFDNEREYSVDVTTRSVPESPDEYAFGDVTDKAGNVVDTSESTFDAVLALKLVNAVETTDMQFYFDYLEYADAPESVTYPFDARW